MSNGRRVYSTRGKGRANKEAGLLLAIKGAGGTAELARRLGVSQPSVSNWLKVPAERVVDVERASGVPRIQLRPDLFAQPRRSSDPDELKA